MIELKHIVRTADDNAFYRIQKSIRYDQITLQNNPEYVDEFRQLCSCDLSFVETWDDP